MVAAAGEAAAVPVLAPAAATICPLVQVMPAGTGPMLWTAPEPHNDQDEPSVSQVTAPSVQVPEEPEEAVPVEDGIGAAAEVATGAASEVAAGAETAAATLETGDSPGTTLGAAASEVATGAEDATPEATAEGVA